MSQCYLCAGEVGPDGASVCAVCVGKTLGPTVRATAEFIVPHVPAEVLDAADRGDAAAHGRCTWCGKGADEVKKLLSNGAVLICNQCVAFCAEVMEAEVGPDWRE